MNAQTTALSIAASERYHTFLDNVILFQREEKMTEEVFADYCEITKQTWQRLKSRTAKTNADTMLKISMSTGIPV